MRGGKAKGRGRKKEGRGKERGERKGRGRKGEGEGRDNHGLQPAQSKFSGYVAGDEVTQSTKCRQQCHRSRNHIQLPVSVYLSLKCISTFALSYFSNIGNVSCSILFSASSVYRGVLSPDNYRARIGYHARLWLRDDVFVPF